MRKIYLILTILSIQFSFGQVRFQNIPESAIYPERTVSQTIFANIPFQGYNETQSFIGEGEYEIFLDTNDGILDKPIIILDGFDPGDSRKIGDIYAGLSFDGQNLGDILRNEGYDIVILNAPVYTSNGVVIDGGSDYIQRNAMVLIALIDKLNADKVGQEELVVFGPSMGGLISRYALSYMETNSMDSETRLFISFDVPHNGANIPISLQYLINYFASVTGDPTAQELIDKVLNSPAAKEMLVDHFSSHINSASPPDQDPTKLLPMGAVGFRDVFQTEFDALGFPSNVRNVAMINGSGNGTTTGTPGMSVINATLNLSPLTVDLSMNFTPAAGLTNSVIDAEVKLVGTVISTYEAKSQSPGTSSGVDSAPGGMSSISDAIGDGGGNQALIDLINNLQQDEYCFIPTMSSLDLNNPDWFATPNLANSPFEAFFVPSQNEPHMTITTQNVQFALDEIRNGAIGIAENQYGLKYILVQNPVKDNIQISVSGNVPNSQLTATVFNISGQLLIEHTWSNAQKNVVMNHNLASGIYLLKLDNGTAVETIKMLVE